MGNLENTIIIIAILFWLPLYGYVGRWYWNRVRTLVDAIEGVYVYVKDYRAEKNETLEKIHI